MKSRAVSAFFFALILALTLAPPVVEAQSDTPPQPKSSGPACTSHTVAQGETLAKIATSFGVTVAKLVSLNNLQDADLIYAGQTLKISCFDPGADQSAEASGSVPLKSPIRLPDAPRVTGAISVGCRLVKVFYSETMNEAAENPANYSIVQVSGDANHSRLVILKARFADDAHTSVELTTLAQDEVRFEIRAIAMRDLTGQPLAPRGVVMGAVIDHASAVFQGTPPGAEDLRDSDGDSLSDTVEQRGWEVNVTLTSGKVVSRRVTSDPAIADTDGDMIPDADEQAFGTDPRSTDTDGDELTDFQELVDVYSDPAMQDSDGDSLMDGLELDFFKTSPTLADTDGDQLTDDKELFSLDRNPLVADLPRMQILVGNARLSLNVLSSYTDESGQVKETQDSLQTTMGTSKEQKFSTSSTVSNETTLKFGQKVGFETGFAAGESKGYFWKLSLEASAEQEIANGFSATTDKESAETATREYQNSVSHGFTQSENRSVTRTAENAEIVADISVENRGDMAFTVRNIELSVLQQDRLNAKRFVPIAALRLEGADNPNEQPAFNLGPGAPARGPLIFKSTTIFPSLVEQYLREPQGLIYKVVNFDLEDEFGRNFAFSNQDVADHTAGITIDYGNGETESYRVATNNLYDENGRMKPITMQRALELIGIVPSTDPTGDTVLTKPQEPGTGTAETPPGPECTDHLVAAGEDLAGIAASLGVAQEDLMNLNGLTSLDTIEAGMRLRIGCPEIQGSYGTQRGADDVEFLTRVRATQTNFTSPDPERFWAVISSGHALPASQDFTAIELRARDDIQLVFTRDQDRDKLLERQEIYYGSKDTAVDSDEDGLSDYAEVNDAWTVTVLGAGARKVFSSPAIRDSDLDGLTDSQEKTYGTDPTQADSDLDGLSDKDELLGPVEILLFDGDADETNNRLMALPSYQGQVIMTGANGICDTTAAAGDEQVTGVQAAGVVAVKAGADGRLDTTPGGDDYVTADHAQACLTDPLNPDTDGDGITDGREVLLGIDPNHQDAGSVIDNDNDGLTDNEENAGWMVNGKRMTSSNMSADTDRDGLPDVYERALGSNPRSRDTDGDKLLDQDEFDPANPNGIYDGLALAEARTRCADAGRCVYTAPDAQRITGTNPGKADTDGEGLTDLEEVTGSWYVKVYGQDRKKVTSDPRIADEDQDLLDDRVERLKGTDPTNPDTDGDGYLDGLEPDMQLDPLRKDYWLTVTLTGVRVDKECEPVGGQDGMELMGKFWLDTPGASDQLLSELKCFGEHAACTWDSCCKDQTRRKCTGESFVFPIPKDEADNQDPASNFRRFKFQEGQKFTLRTSKLEDNNEAAPTCGLNLKNPIGSLNEVFEFKLDLPDTFSKEVSNGTCKITLNYTFVKGK